MDQHTGTTLAIARAMADELTDYLMGDALYRQLVVKTPEGVRQPKMTIGALLENLEILQWQRDALDPEQRAALATIAGQVDLARSAFGPQWHALLRRELKASMDTWKWYLDDAARDADARANYASEARVRTRIDLVMRALAGDPQAAADKNELGALDAQLRGMMAGSGYVGPSGQQGHYPRSQAWWLYGSPAGAD